MDDDEARTMTTDLSDYGSRVNSGSERIYSGRESPVKQYTPRTTLEMNARMSAGTTDSFDYAFQREPSATITNTNDALNNEDFFDR